MHDRLINEKDTTKTITGFVILGANYPQNNVNNKIVWNLKHMSESKKIYDRFKRFLTQQNVLPKIVSDPLTNTASIAMVSGSPVNIDLSYTSFNGIHQVNKTKIHDKKMSRTRIARKMNEFVS